MFCCNVYLELYASIGLWFSGLQTVAKLIGCEIEELKLALSTRKMRIGNDSIVQKLTLSQARNLFRKTLLYILWGP